MPPARRKRRKARSPGTHSQHTASSALRRLVHWAARALLRCGAFLSRLLFRARGAVAVLLTVSLFGFVFLIFKEKVMDRFEGNLPAAVRLEGSNAELLKILEPPVLQFLKQANQKKWSRQKFDQEVAQALSSEPAVRGAVLRYRIGGNLDITVTAHTPSFALTDSSGSRYVFDAIGGLIGKAPVRGLGPAGLSVVLKNEVIKLRSGRAITKVGPVSQLLHRAQSVTQALSAYGVGISGSIQFEVDPGLSLCARVAEMAPDSCVEVVVGQDLPTRDYLVYLRDQLTKLAHGGGASWPASIDLTLKDRVLVRGLGSQGSSATSQTSRDVE